MMPAMLALSALCVRAGIAGRRHTTHTPREFS
jgi:hypothetical protein